MGQPHHPTDVPGWVRRSSQAVKVAVTPRGTHFSKALNTSHYYRIVMKALGLLGGTFDRFHKGHRKLLETGTSNLLFVKDQKFFTPKKGYYEGNTFKFFKTKIRKIFKKDILLKEINDYDEILLLGSGKGVTSVKTINEIKWKRKNLDKFRFLSKHYNAAINKCNSYRF